MEQYIKKQPKREHHIHGCPVLTVNALSSPDIDLDEVCSELETTIPPRALDNIDVIYIGNFPELRGRNAMYDNGAIYITNEEVTNLDMLENIYHEIAHSLEETYGAQIYDEELTREFLVKRKKLRELLDAQGHQIPEAYYLNTEYSKKFDMFLVDVVGYPMLITLTMGLFVSPYGATSLQEYFANGFEKYLLGEGRAIQKISPVLYSKIESILHDA